MSTVVAGLAASHAPMFEPEDPDETSYRERADRFLNDGLARGHELIAAAEPDVVVIFGASHLKFHSLESVPPFTVGIGVCGCVEDGAVIPVDRELSNGIVEGLLARDFDVATSLKLQVDHGVAHAHSHLVGDLDVPIVPLVINAAIAPQPSMRRCKQFGEAVREIIESDGQVRRVAVIGSGGLSHWSPDIPRWVANASDDDKAFVQEMFPDGGYRSVFVGTPRADDWDSIMAPSDAPIRREHDWGDYKRINAEFDEHFLDLLARRDWDAIVAYSGADLEQAAGLGGQEIRCWVAAAAAAGGPATTLTYIDMTEWDTGMGVAQFAIEPIGISA
jgi:2,3-dihydroxyphenylpropionate 1,2-dioxygenase